MSGLSQQAALISSFTCDELAAFLKQKGIKEDVCQILIDSEVEGDVFIDFPKEDFEKLGIKLGVVGKLTKIQKAIQSETVHTQGNTSHSTVGSRSELPVPSVAPKPAVKPRMAKATEHSNAWSKTTATNTTRTLTSSSFGGSVKQKIGRIEEDSNCTTNKPHRPFSHAMPAKDPVMVQFSNPDKVDVSTLSCDEFATWLSTKNFSAEHCQAFIDHDVTGSVFLDLERDDLKDIVKPIGTIKQLLNLQLELKNKVKAQSKHSTNSSNSVMEHATKVMEEDSAKNIFCEYLKLTGLNEKFPNKLKVIEALTICKETLADVSETEDIKLLPFLILQKIMMFESKSRKSLFKGKLNGCVFLKSQDEIHPLDNFSVLLHCSDNFLAQDILTKLSTCQLAVPFLLPNPYDGSVTFLLWALRGIVRTWKSHKSNGESISHECRIVDYPAPIISFFKIGELQISKSRILNEVINSDESKQDFFFHYDCEGGEAERQFIDGMAELCCYLPSGKPNAASFYSNILMFSNLRGDARKYSKQAKLIQKISFMSFVLLNQSDLDDGDITLLKFLADTPGKAVLMFADLKEGENLQNKQHRELLQGFEAVKLKGKSIAKIRNQVQKQIKVQLNACAQLPNVRLSECAKYACTFGLQVDEDDAGCMKGKQLAENVMNKICSVPASEAKLKQLPLQGPDLWHKWAKYDKECYRQLARNLACVDVYSGDMDRKKQAVRQNQFHFTKKPTAVMKEFLAGLKGHFGNVQLYYICWLKMLLDDYSRKVLPGLHDAYQETRAKLMEEKGKEKNLAEHSQGISAIVKQLQEKLKLQNEQLVNASFGLEHLFREMGQMYEARMDSQLKSVPIELKDEANLFPQIVADLMNEGYPVELMDGDAAHVPITWVLAVVSKLNERHSKRQKIFVISVLGIQSTGKSTLLNTVFGLRFNVSAGRCTRGAYFQLLPLDSALQQEIGCKHILVVDTEGLRAPELQYQDALKHDNELATFVIGLADLTIINIYGETPGELTDILQTAVHAFIRMKLVDMQLSCNFVHQNVTAVMAESKSKVGRQNFQDKLDFMTITAAKVEKCEGRFRSFQSVIAFNDETDVTFFPSLWQGDPPMAPVNPGYTSKACALKQSIINKAQNVTTHCTFGNFQTRITKLWEAVLQEKFVFSFKNTLEVAAYNELDTKYGHWSWSLQHKLLEWQHEAENEISSCDASTIDSVASNCLLKIQTDLDDIHITLITEMTEFFETSDKGETLAQWQKHTEIRLQNLCNEHKDEAKKHCNILKLNREGRVKIDHVQQDYREKIQTSIISLASDPKNRGLTSEQRQEIFDDEWDQWMTEFSLNQQPVKYTTEPTMVREITSLLEEKYVSQSHLVLKSLKSKPLSSRGSLQLNIEVHHLDSKGLMENAGKAIRNLGHKVGLAEKQKYASVSSEDVESATQKTFALFNKVEKWMEKTISRFQEFNKMIVSDLLRKLHEEITNLNKNNSKYSFTLHYMVDMATTVAGYAYKQFVVKICQLEVENNPVESLKRLKPIFFRMFDTQFTEASNDQLAAHNLCNIITKPITDALIEKLRIEVVDDMKVSVNFVEKKKFFKVQVMKDLAATRDFKQYKAYLSNIGSSLKEWSKFYVKQHCAKTTKRNKVFLYNLAEVKLNKIIRVIIDALDISGSYDNTSETDLCSLKDFDDSVQYVEMKQWLQGFHEKIKKTMVTDLSEMLQMVGVQNIHNLAFFTRQFANILKIEAKKILADFENFNLSFSKVIDSSKSPHIALYNSLIGCTEQCPFCKEQCEITDENHLTSKQCHYTEIHRPRCLGGRTWNEDGKLVLDICTVAVESDSTSFKNSDTGGKYIPYKDYKSIYKNWLISNESPKTGPKYWEWFVAQFNSDIVSWVGAVPTPVNHLGWNDISKDAAIDSLSQTYALQTD